MDQGLAALWTGAITAVAALIIGVATVVQARRAARREQWWARTQWALDGVFQETAVQRAVAINVLAVLSVSPLVNVDESSMLEAVMDVVLSDFPGGQP